MHYCSCTHCRINITSAHSQKSSYNVCSFDDWPLVLTFFPFSFAFSLLPPRYSAPHGTTTTGHDLFFDRHFFEDLPRPITTDRDRTNSSQLVNHQYFVRSERPKPPFVIHRRQISPHPDNNIIYSGAKTKADYRSVEI